ncbi:MAG: SMC-Scp complex subunit ScpB [Acidobacteria bacterium]|nr:SMC-Scp complex subunit ScpB [Acidobacteriota bacterium]
MKDYTQLKAAIEAILYVADEPVTLDKLREAFPEAETEILTAVLDDLQQDYKSESRGLTLRRLAGGYQLFTRLEYHEHVQKFLRTRPGFRLSMAALETLAIIAYKQPVTIPEILEIRQVKSPAAIKTLVEKKMIVPRGRKKALGAPIQYGTSKEFLVQFGLDSLKDLPSLEEFEDLFGDKADTIRQKSLFDLKMRGIEPLQNTDTATGFEQE